MALVGSVDVELLVIEWLRSHLDDSVIVRDELDNSLAAELPTVQVQRVAAGGDDGFRVDRAFIDVDVYHGTRGEAIALALEARGLLLTGLPGSTTGGAVIGAVRTLTPPAIRPYENTGLRRVGATYEIYSHPA